jgi:hypothetical protein
MSIFDMFAGVAIFIGDVLAILSLIGSIAIFAVGFRNLGADRRIRVPSQMQLWSFLGLFVGVLGYIGLVVSNTKAERIGLFFKMSPTVFGGILLLSLILLIAKMFIPSRSAHPTRSGRKR